MFEDDEDGRVRARATFVSFVQSSNTSHAVIASVLVPDSSSPAAPVASPIGPISAPDAPRA